MKSDLVIIGAFLAGALVGLVGGIVAAPHLQQLNQSPTERLIAEADEMLAVQRYELFNPTLALHELRKGRTTCAFCLLESELNAQVSGLKEVLSKASQDARDHAAGELKFAEEYLAEYPYSELACRGACED